MRKFDPEILKYLNKECNGEPVHFVGLGIYDFQISFGYVNRLQTMEKAIFSINGEHYIWEEGPCDIPVWRLVGQVPSHFELPTLLALRLCFISNDFVEFHTAEHQWESTIIDLGFRDDIQQLDVF